MRKLHLDRAYLPEGFRRDVQLTLDAAGIITAIGFGQADPAAERVSGIALPGLPNLHSHAHQRAMAGLAEAAGSGEDSFWTWRQVMYRFLQRMTPDDLQAIATQLYVEMLKAGFTAVAEFHYLHRDPDGQAYADPAELSHRIIEAARESGIGLTHLPVLYAASGFGAKPLTEGQRRFRMEAEDLLELVGRLRPEGSVRLGIAPHSLRAAPPEQLRAVLKEIEATAPVHIHIAEQTGEVEDCLAWSGRRPVEWLLDEMPVDRRWCLVHATHMTETETERLAASGAVAGLCPTTEANLGDGFFPAYHYLKAGGRFGIGSDSHISVSPIEELRWLEYGERLMRRRRAVLAGGAGRSTGRALFDAALAGGAQALGQPVGALAVGLRCDLIILDDQNPLLVGRDGEALLDSFIFAGNHNPVRDVMVAGRWVISDGHHPREAEIAAQYRRAVEHLQDR